MPYTPAASSAPESYVIIVTFVAISARFAVVLLELGSECRVEIFAETVWKLLVSGLRKKLHLEPIDFLRCACWGVFRVVCCAVSSPRPNCLLD